MLLRLCCGTLQLVALLGRLLLPSGAFTFHFSAQPQPYLSLNCLTARYQSLKECSRQAKKWTSVSACLPLLGSVLPPSDQPSRLVLHLGSGTHPSPRHSMPLYSRNEGSKCVEGLAEIIRRVIGCPSTQPTRVQMRSRPGGHCWPRQRMPFNSRDEGAKCESMTWRLAGNGPGKCCSSTPRHSMPFDSRDEVSGCLSIT